MKAGRGRRSLWWHMERVHAPAPVSEPGPMLCRLKHAAGWDEPCPGASCPFWEEGGAIVGGGCVLDRFGLDLDRRPALVHALLQVHRKLGQAVSAEDEQEAHALFARLVGVEEEPPA